jgi:integral membrane sensor domain MASE1
MPVNKLIIFAVVLCLLLSAFSTGLLSAVLDLCAFALLVICLFKYRQQSRKKDCLKENGSSESNPVL